MLHLTFIVSFSNGPFRYPPSLRAIVLALKIAIGLIAVLVAIGSFPLYAQEDTADPHPLKSADTSSPQATMKSFIDTFDEIFHRFFREGRSFRNEAERQALVYRALRCLDLSEVPSSVSTSVGSEAAICLKEVLDRIELPPENTWPDTEQITEKSITRWTIPNTEITIARVKEGPREGEFLFTPETVERAIDFYDIVKDLPYKNKDKVTPGMYHFYLSEPG